MNSEHFWFLVTVLLSFKTGKATVNLRSEGIGIGFIRILHMTSFCLQDIDKFQKGADALDLEELPPQEAYY